MAAPPPAASNAVAVDRLLLTARQYRLENFCKTEIEHLDGPVYPQLDVVGLQIAMRDTVLMCRLERGRNLPRDLERLGQWDWLAGNAFG